MSTHIRTRCTCCGASLDAPARRLLVELPHPNTDAAPRLVVPCPACGAVGTTEVGWRTTAYLLHDGTTALLGPDPLLVAPVYPEQRPADVPPLTLDDLLELHEALASPSSPDRRKP